MGAYRIEISNSATPEPRVLMLRGVDRDTADACVAAIEAAVRAAQSSVALILDFAPGQDLTVQCDGFTGARVVPHDQESYGTILGPESVRNDS